MDTFMDNLRYYALEPPALQMTLFVLVITLLYFYRKSQFKVFENIGVRGPTPNIIWGNTAEIFKLGAVEIEGKCIREYGKTFGLFNGPTPTLYITDADMIRDITIKQFEKFINRPRFPLANPYPVDLILFQMRDEQWRRVRTLLSPSFTTNKLKFTTQLMDKCAKRLSDVIANRVSNNQKVEFKELSEAMALDVIGNCFFGVECNTQMDDKDAFLLKVRAWMKYIFRIDIFLILVFLFPSWRPVLSYLKWTLRRGKLPSHDLVEMVKGVIAQRRQDPSTRRPDMLQLMIDSASDIKDGSLEENQEDEDQAKDYAKLTENEIIAQCFVFLFAGYETVSRSLAYIMYLLTINPDVQDKIYDEILEHFQGEDHLTYETIKHMTFLDMVVNESIRYLPATTGIFRECSQTCKLGDVTIPRGMTINIPTSQIQKDPELWPDPESFRPERFSSENKTKLPPYGMLTFGLGPRNCIGNRFSLLEIKMAIVRVLQKFKLLENKDTKSRFIYSPLAFPLPKPVDWRVFCDVERRQV